MMKGLFIVLTILVAAFLLFFPFWHVGGNYRRGLLLIYYVERQNNIPIPFQFWNINLIDWAEPISFEYVNGRYAKDRFHVYRKYRLDDTDPETFRMVQAPITGETFYVDKNNARLYDALILKLVPGEGNDVVVEKFDMESFQPAGANLIKDKNGVYSFSRYAPFNEDMHQPDGLDNCDINLFKRHEELDTDTFKIDFCNKTKCRASDKNAVYTLNHFKGPEKITIVKESQ